MKLYRITVITPIENINRGVWAHSYGIENSYGIGNNHITFVDEYGDLIASYPSSITMITNVETKEQYEARKGKE